MFTIPRRNVAPLWMVTVPAGTATPLGCEAERPVPGGDAVHQTMGPRHDPGSASVILDDADRIRLDDQGGHQAGGAGASPGGVHGAVDYVGRGVGSQSVEGRADDGAGARVRTASPPRVTTGSTSVTSRASRPIAVSSAVEAEPARCHGPPRPRAPRPMRRRKRTGCGRTDAAGRARLSPAGHALGEGSGEVKAGWVAGAPADPAVSLELREVGRDRQPSDRMELRGHLAIHPGYDLDERLGADRHRV